MALGPGLPTKMVCPSPFWRTTSVVPMVPPPPERFSTMADWPQAFWRCAASNRPITSVVPPGAAGTMRRTVSVGRQSAAWPRRGKVAVAENAAAADSTLRRESLVVTCHSLLRLLLFCGERRECAAGRQAADRPSSRVEHASSATPCHKRPHRLVLCHGYAAILAGLDVGNFEAKFRQELAIDCCREMNP